MHRTPRAAPVRTATPIRQHAPRTTTTQNSNPRNLEGNTDMGRGGHLTIQRSAQRYYRCERERGKEEEEEIKMTVTIRAAGAQVYISGQDGDPLRWQASSG
eukprot:3626392-Pyramimonas_sp.AAC.1